MNGIGLCEHSLGYDRDEKLDGHKHNGESSERHLSVSRSAFNFLAPTLGGLASLMRAFEACCTQVSGVGTYGYHHRAGG